MCLLLLTTFPALAAEASPCVPAPRAPGTLIYAPHAAFEAYVVEVHEAQDSQSAFGVLHTRRALVEVVRSFHGPYSPGQQVETLTIETMRGCALSIEEGGHVMVVSESGGPFEIVESLPKAQVIPQGPFAALSYAAGEPRRSLRPTLKDASLRGEIDAGLASELRARAQPERRERCDIVSDGNFAQVSWGKAFGGNDARFKVIFERAKGGWTEVMRYEAPAPTPARNKGKGSKRRTLWANEPTVRFPADASAS
jgi:hypothetical protein